MPQPSRDDGYLVFAQQSGTRVDVDAWNAHAMRFFATRIGLTSDASYPDARASSPDSLVFVVAADAEPVGLCSVFTRLCEVDDYQLAAAAEARTGPTGLSDLARRCRAVWLVVREPPSDRLALRLAAILASILLGPILDAAAGELFGVKTARAKLAGNR